MSGLLSFAFAIIGIVWICAGKPFLEVAACFLICAFFEGCWELHLLRKDLEDGDK